MSHLCGGFPPGHACPITIESDDVELCTSCQYRARVFAQHKLPSRMVPVGIVLEDFTGPSLACKCGGDSTEVDHKHSLQHAIWAWKQGEAEPQDTNAFADHRTATLR